MQFDAAETFWDWVRSYVARPHPEIGRRGAVCPFVPALLKNGGIYLEVHCSVDGTDPEAMEEILRAAVPKFLALPHLPQSKSLVLLFPAIPEDRGEVVDLVQGNLKSDIVRSGLMAGQFHPRSTEAGARNPDFYADRSPLPLIVLRHMAIHDVLFLDSNPEWFEEYFRRFGSEYERRRVRDPLLRERFTAACERRLERQAA